MQHNTLFPLLVIIEHKKVNQYFWKFENIMFQIFQFYGPWTK